jgi:hypothetical protein
MLMKGIFWTLKVIKHLAEELRLIFGIMEWGNLESNCIIDKSNDVCLKFYQFVRISSVLDGMSSVC